MTRRTTPARLRVFRPAPDAERPLPTLRWLVGGWPVEVVLYPPNQDGSRPTATPMAQIHPTTGIWIELRCADSRLWESGETP